jgi:class 3 adenylate cyclase
MVGDGRYVVRRLLGEGARKRVYLALDRRLDREVAVAVVKTEGLDDAGRHRIAREARAMARLGDHPNIVTVFDVGDDDDDPYIVSQFMSGGSVEELLRRSEGHRLQLDAALRIVQQLARALEHSHVLGIVHRDLKPANVWLAADGTAKLGDFGLAVPTDQSRLTAEGMVVGTVAYLAPEQALGHQPDGRADLYSLGAMTYEMLTGRPPFLGDDAVAVISQHLNTAPVAPTWHNAGVPPAVEALVMALLAKDPAARPESASTVVTEVQRILDSSMEPVAVELEAPGGVRALAAEWGRFVGRVEELAEVKAAFDAALGGRGGLVMVVGEPGIGKTRLVEELGAYATMRGAQVCWGHSYEGEVGLPYLPFVEAFRAYVRDREDDELRAELSTGAPEVATLVSELRQRFPDLPESPPLEGDAERLRLFQGVSEFLHNAAVARPIVLVLDDLHWADKPTLLLLQYLARNLRRDRLLVVGTYRDVELDRTHPLADVVATLRREQLYRRVLLRGLPRDDVKSFIEIIGDQQTPDEFADVIHRETEGNPFFVAEILRHLADTGGIQRVEGRWVGTPESVAANLPEGVREVIGRRLDRLSDDCNRMLTIAAAMPGGFSIDIVARITGDDIDHMLDLLDEALAAQVVRERRDAPASYEFSHALIRQTLYGELNTPRRVRMHRQIADALEQQYAANDEPHLPELAYHWFQAAPAGEAHRAVDYAVRAAERASRQAAHEETAKFFDLALQALEFVDGVDDAQEAELLIGLGEARNRAGELDAARSALWRAADLARGVDDPELLARAVLTFAELRWASSVYDEELVGRLGEATRILGDRDPVLRSQLLSRQAAQVMFFDSTRFGDLADDAVAAARVADDPGSLALALTMQTWGERLVAGAQDLCDRYEEIASLARAANNSDLVLSSTWNLLVNGMYSGDPSAVATHLDEISRLAAESRSPTHLVNAMTARGAVAALRGDYAETDRLAGEILSQGHRMGDESLVQIVGVLLFPVFRERGRLVEFESATRRVVQEASTVAAWRAGLATILLESGRHDEARRVVADLGADDFASVNEDVTLTFTLASIGEAAANLGGLDEVVAGAYERLLPSRAMHVILGNSAYHGSVERYLGLLAMSRGDATLAIEHLESAMTAHEVMRARPWTARTRYDLARGHLLRDGPGDRERAVTLLNRALDTANEIGMPRLVEQALEAKLGLQGVASLSSPELSIDVVAAAVSMERPSLVEGSPDGRVTIMFSDIEGYTELTERLGDARTQDVLHSHNEIVEREVAARGGRVVKSQGDGFMLAFAGVPDALRCAVAIERAVAACDFGPDAGALRVRIGLHVGDAIREGDDFYGRTVIVASRVAAVATGGEILVTEEVRSLAGDAVQFRAGRELSLKGLRRPQRVYSLA